MQIKIWNFKFEIFKSKTSNIEFHSSKIWSFEKKKLHIWSYKVSFGDVLINGYWGPNGSN